MPKARTAKNNSNSSRTKNSSRSRAKNSSRSRNNSRSRSNSNANSNNGNNSNGNNNSDMKYEIANELGVNLGANCSARDNGAVGGEITKRLIEFANRRMNRSKKQARK